MRIANMMNDVKKKVSKYYKITVAYININSTFTYYLKTLTNI